MTLEALASVGEIGRLDTGMQEIGGFLDIAKRKLNDAKCENISRETRLEQAYTVIFSCATISLRVMNYRVLKASAKHYLTIETLRYTLKLDVQNIEYFQSLRVLRHQDIYGPGIRINDADLQEAIMEAENLLELTLNWLSKNHPQMLR